MDSESIRLKLYVFGYLPYFITDNSNSMIHLTNMHQIHNDQNNWHNDKEVIFMQTDSEVKTEDLWAGKVTSLLICSAIFYRQVRAVKDKDPICFFIREDGIAQNRKCGFLRSYELFLCLNSSRSHNSQNQLPVGTIPPFLGCFEYIMPSKN